ncbi:Acetyltransferase (GNAT) family protein [Gimesia aquarii]|uniref:Acetyltransferase (GNAT) family protein n=1 Tax=Gimesia aquarii TaxID=2527964 RepID=A0A517X3V2_9PLAN|nr:Acetyltransferase (GNAT) family protein [Gimesia aquarii]
MIVRPVNSIKVTAEVRASELEAILTWLRDFNYQQNGEFMESLDRGQELPLFLSARDVHDEVIGGLQGSFLHQWLRIDVMAVLSNYRSMGVGCLLVTEAERMAVDRGCRSSYVDTMSYQAPDFYRRLGYREVGCLPNWDSHGHDKHFFMKDLS